MRTQSHKLDVKSEGRDVQRKRSERVWRSMEARESWDTWDSSLLHLFF